jgi:hypothetical protein
VKLQINGYWVNDVQEGDEIMARSDDGNNEVEIWRNGKVIREYAYRSKWYDRPAGDYICVYDDGDWMKSTYVPYNEEAEKSK